MLDEKREVLRKAMVNRINHLIRLGEPFSWKDIPNTELVGLSTDVDEEHPNWALNQEFNTALGLAQFRGKMWRKYDLTSGKAERKDGNIVLYPSNDRERFHLKPMEKFIDHKVTGGKLRKAIEPPVRLSEAPVTPTGEEPAGVTSGAVDWRGIAVALAESVSTLTKTIDQIAGGLRE